MSHFGAGPGRISRAVTLLIVLLLGGSAIGCGDAGNPGAGTAEATVTPSTITEATSAAAPAISTATTLPAATTPAIDPPPVLREDTPPLVNIDGWLASDVTSLEELRGSVVVVEFWTFGCYNCRNRMPHNRELYAKYRDRGMKMVGIHSPEFRYEREVAAIEQAMADLGVIWPVVLDTERRTFRAWQGRPAYWPRTYVLDKQGRVRYDHIGEGAYEELDRVVGHLLTESA